MWPRRAARAQEVLGVTQINGSAVAEDLIRHPAGLGALAPVGRPTAESLAGEALTQVRDAECPLDEHFARQVRLLPDRRDLSDR